MQKVTGCAVGGCGNAMPVKRWNRGRAKCRSCVKMRQSVWHLLMKMPTDGHTKKHRWQKKQEAQNAPA